MKTHHYLYLLLSVAAYGCGGSGDEPTPVPVDPVTPVEPEHAMTFHASGIDGKASRAALEDSYTLFRVYTDKTTATGVETVMPGYNVRYVNATDRWQYHGAAYPAETALDGQLLKYWDAAATQYDFYAYAPVDLSAPKSDTPSFPGLQAHIPAADATDIDLLVAHQRRTLAPLEDTDVLAGEVWTAPDPVPTIFYDIVPLRFHHIFSQVEFRLCNVGNNPAQLSSAIIKLDDDTRVHYFTSGTFDALQGWVCTYEDWAPSGNLVDYTVPEPDESVTVYPLGDNPKETHSTLLSSTIEIPQTMLDKVVNVTLIIDETPLSASFAIPDNWQYDKKYIYYLKFVTSDIRPIFVDVEVEDFLRGDIIDNTQTNW